MPQELPEMIELLITNKQTPSGRAFVTVMEQFIQRSPMIHSTDKNEFFIAYFLGGIYNFQYTQLKTDLQVTASFWKWGEGENTLDFVFEMTHRDNSNKHLIFRSITVLNQNGSPYAGRITPERPYSDLAFQDVMLAKVVYKNADHTGGLNFKEEFYQTRFMPQLNTDSSAESEFKLQALGFEKIQAEPSINGIDERKIQKLSLDEAEVKEALASYLSGNVDLFQKFKPIFKAQAENAKNPNLSHHKNTNFNKIMQKVSTEAFSHGFLYGSLSLNFKNRYDIDCYVERIAGNGYTDLMMTSRTNNRRSDSVPIIIELKAGLATAREAITQIENKGYFQHVLSLRSYHEKVVIAGVNYNLADEENRLGRGQRTTRGDIIAVNEAQIPTKNDVIGQILKTSIDDLSDYAVRREKIQKNLMDLYYSHFGELNFRSFLSLLVGYVISYNDIPLDQNNNLNDPLMLKKSFLLLNNHLLQSRFAVLAIDFQDKGVKKTIVFELSAETGARTRHQPENPITAALHFLYSQRKNQQTNVHKISIKIDATKTQADFFSSIDLECITNLASFDTGTAVNLLKGRFHELKTLTFSNFFTTKHTGLFDFSSTLKDKVQETLFPLRSLFQGEVGGQKKEFVFQAIMQGMIAGFNQEARRVRVFVEPNYSAQGRADLVVVLPSFSAQKKLVAESLFIFELKSLASSHMMSSSASMALEQAKKYTENLKSLSDERTVALMGLVMNSQAKAKQDFLAECSSKHAVDHISTDERLSSPERSPNKRKRVNPASSSEEENTPKRRCQRSVGISCLIDFMQDPDESTLMTDLAEARQRGHVILLADSYAVLVALIKVNNPMGKIFLLDENVERLNRVFQMLMQAEVSETLETYLQAIQLKFPKAARVLEQGIAQLGDSIDFEQFKSMLADNQLSLITMNGFSHRQNGLRQHLGIENERIAAIYVGDYEYRRMGWENSAQASLKGPALKEHVLSLLSSEDRTDLYRRTSPDNDNQISFYSGSKAYLEREWQQPIEESLFSFDSHEESLHLLKAAQDWCAAIKQSSSFNFNKDWIPILETAREGYSGKEQIHFLHANTHDLHIIELDGISSTILRENLNLLYEGMADATAFKKNIPESLGDPTENTESVDGLNMAFTVQAVFDLVKAKDRAQFQTEQGPLYTAIQVHHYLNLAQMAHSTILDVNKVVEIVKTLLHEEVSLAEKPLSFFQLSLKQGVGEGLGALFGVGNVVLDSIELHAAKTEQEKTTFIAQLTLDIGGLSLSAASMGAAYVGSATAASVLGAGSVIFSGLAIGTMALVQAFGAVARRAEAVGSYFHRLDDAYRRKGYTNQLFSQDNESFMNPIYGAVVTEINFINDSISYGSPYIYAAHYQGSGNGEGNYLIGLSALPRVIRKKQQAINIRERLGYAQSAGLGNWKVVSTWVLPNTPIVYLDYDWMALPGATSRHDRGFSVLRKLEKERHNFYYDFYSFPSEFIINEIHEEIVTTPVKIILNEQERTLVIPNFSEHDNNIYNNLHYQIEAPVTPGHCSIVLNRMGSLTLLSQHEHYIWTLLTEDFSEDRMRFTETGIEIADALLIKSTSPYNGKYLLVDKNLFVFAIDWPMKKLLLKELHFPFFKNNSHALTAYVKNKSFNTPIKLNDFPLHDPQIGPYKGIAYYAEEGPYIYTADFPKFINRKTNLIGCVIDNCYFIALPNLFWRSHRYTHQLKENYLFYSDALINFVITEKILEEAKAQIESVVIQPDESIKILRVLKNEHEKVVQRTHYHLIQDELILFALENDALSRIFIHTQDAAKLRIYLKRFFDQNPSLLPLWNDYPQNYAKVLAAEMNHCIKIMSLSEVVSSHPVWLLKKSNDHYYVINPRIAETQLTFLGALSTADGSDIFYFFLPAQNQSPAQLFRQPARAAAATPLDLSLTQAYFAKGMLFILTPENIIKKLNVLGETSIVSFNTAWIQNHASDWWEKIPALLMAEKHSGKDPIRLYGLNDRSGKALAVWYKLDQPSFVMMHPPMKPTGESFYVSYLARVAGIDFFFCDNGMLYQQTSCSDAMPTYFQETQLKRELPPLVVLADSLQTAYFHKQRLWLNQNSAIFSLNPMLPKIAYLEKIEFSWFQREPVYEPFLSNKTHFIQRFKSEFRERYESDLFRSDVPFTTINFLDKSSLFISTRKKSLIPIMLDGEKNLWWNPNEDTFFYNPFKEDTSDWRYLGVCADLRNVTGACFFSPKAKMLYFNPDYQHYQGEIFYPDIKIATELAMSHQDVFLCVLDQVLHLWPAFFPLFRDEKKLNLYISNESAYTFDVPQIILDHYQVTFYQSFSLSKKTLNFPFRGKMEYKKNGRDIIFFGSTVTGAWSFLEGMQDEIWDRTIFDIEPSYSRYTVYSSLKKTRECLLHRNAENVSIASSFNACLWFQSEASLLSSSDFPRYVHHSRHHHAIERPGFVEKRLNTLEKAPEMSPWLIISSLSAVLGTVAGGVYCVFTRRFRQNKPAALPMAAAVSIPLLAQSIPSVSAAAEANSVVHCRKDFFKQTHCIQNESSIGLLGYCNNGREALLWLLNKHHATTDVTTLLWYMLGHPSELALSNNATLNWEATSVTVSSHYLYFNPGRSCRQTLDLRKIQPVSMAFLFPYLPNEAQRWLQAQWSHEKGLRDKVLQDETASHLFKQLATSVGLNYFASECLLQTSVGDFFQLFGLRPNWREQDHRYYLARCLTTGQQLCLSDHNKTSPIMTIVALGLETTLLHPKLQAKYFGVSCKNSYYAKQAVRFLADLLQFGNTNFAYLPSVLEFLFSDYAPISMITLGLRTALSLFSINNDLSYYYLGIALFLLPQLPLLLEHLGIPVTHYVSQTLEKLTQFFIAQSLIVSFVIKPDQERLIEKESALSAAKQRVEQGRQRLTRIAKPIVGFFNSATGQGVDIQDELIESPQNRPT